MNMLPHGCSVFLSASLHVPVIEQLHSQSPSSFENILWLCSWNLSVSTKMTLDKPQIHTISSHSLNYSAYDIKWLPLSAKFITIGQKANGNGILQLFSLNGADVSVLSDRETEFALKCATFGASPLHARHVATGDFKGNLQIWDIEKLSRPVLTIPAHEGIINAIDGAGGVGVDCGPPEIATASSDGSVKIWDTRQKDRPVATIAPAQGEKKRDAWTVAFGNAYNDQERMVCTGYENGDVKLFDLRSMSLNYETNVKNGVCSIQFDRKDIKMNKLIVTTLESTIHAFDLRTKHPKSGFASTSIKLSDNTTIWMAKHLPQNRDVFIASGGKGALNLMRYKYPPERSKLDVDKKHPEGVAGTIEILNDATVSEQPVNAFDWNPDKLGLCAFTAFDQQVRVGVVTKLNLL